VEWLEDRATPATWTFEVNTSSDAPVPGARGLRDAIAEANAQAAGDTSNITFHDSIFMGGNTATITLSSVLPGLGRAGAGHTVNITAPAGKTVTVRRDPTAAADFRIFTVTQLTTANLTGITATGGRLMGGGDGGGIYVDDSATLTLNRSVVTDNRVRGTGGGIYLSPFATSLTLTAASTVDTNQADGNGGGIYIGGARNGNLNRVTITQGSEVRTNTSVLGSGGGIYVSQWGTGAPDGLTINANSKVNGNTARLDGGGIYVEPAAQFRGTFTDIDVRDNRSTDGKGGAIFTGGPIVATRMMVFGNRGGLAAGYAVAVDTSAVPRPLDLISCQVGNNAFLPPGGGPLPPSGAIDAGNGGILFKNTSVGNNVGNGVWGTVVSQGGNTIMASRTTSTGWLPPPQDNVT
jgi:hypothetical protein